MRVGHAIVKLAVIYATSPKQRPQHREEMHPFLSPLDHVCYHAGEKLANLQEEIDHFPYPHWWGEALKQEELEERAELVRQGKLSNQFFKEEEE